jgi:pyridoxine 5-phosphate synthase
MTRLSVNLNKIALIRNARGSNLPDLIQVAKDCERFGADGITVHPRPDERHIRYADCHDLKPVVTTEFNIEGYPSPKWVELVKQIKPAQATLVPDPPDALTSDTGWDTLKNKAFLQEIISEIKSEGIRVSLFIDPIEQFIEGAKAVGADRIELYTGPFAHLFNSNPQKSIEAYIPAAGYAHKIGLGINAGHDLNLDNLAFFHQHIPKLDEVSIGHALVSDALYYGLENVIMMYKRQLEPAND